MASTASAKSAKRTSPDPTRLSDRELDRQSRIAEAHHLAERKAGRVAVSARYDADAERIEVEMSTGWMFSIPVRAIYPELRGATAEQLAAVTVDPLGAGLHWRALDVDVSVLGLLFELLGQRELMAAAGRAGGQVRSGPKIAAARANGAKGGRPRKAAKKVGAR